MMDAIETRLPPLRVELPRRALEANVFGDDGGGFVWIDLKGHFDSLA